MKPFIGWMLILCALPATPARADAPTAHRKTLGNSIRFAYLYVNDSPNFSAFTFLPMGLGNDDAGQAQWAHLIEHMTIRSIDPVVRQDFNAETMADQMRLDFYGSKADWREILQHHAKWLGASPFAEAIVKQEAAAANSEVDFVVPKLMTHKFAIAGWNQAYRHGRQNVAIKGDLLAASPAALQSFRDARMLVKDQVLICAIGGVEPEAVLSAAEESFGALKLAAEAPKHLKIERHAAAATWDLPVDHLLLAWPIPGPDQPDAHAAMTVLASLLWSQLGQDADLQRLAGPILLGTDLRSPEGSYFYSSAALKSGNDASAVRQRVTQAIDAIAAGRMPPIPVQMIGQQLAMQDGMIDLDMMRAQMRGGMPAWAPEAQLAITWGSAEYRLGEHRDRLIRSLRSVTAETIQTAAQKYLAADQCISVELRAQGEKAK